MPSLQDGVPGPPSVQTAGSRTLGFPSRPQADRNTPRALGMKDGEPVLVQETFFICENRDQESQG